MHSAGAVWGPRSSAHPNPYSSNLSPLQWLEMWYGRLGYIKGAPEDFAAAFPRIAPLLAVPCEFTVYLKPLHRTSKVGTVEPTFNL